MHGRADNLVDRSLVKVDNKVEVWICHTVMEKSLLVKA